MAIIEHLNLFDARADLAKAASRAIAKRSLTSDATASVLGSGGGHGGFSAAKLTRLNGDWAASSRSMDQDLMADLRRLRQRARNQAINSPIASKFLGMVRSNVIGAHGMKMAFKVAQVRKSKKGSGLDDVSNQELARAWHEWSQRGNLTVCGRYSLPELERLAVENVARDGEIFFRKVFVPKSESVFGFKLQLIDPDQVDDSYNLAAMANGNSIRMGVEVDEYLKPVAYYVFQGNPNEISASTARRVRVPAEEMIHVFIAHRTGQTRGYPWFSSSMSQLNMLDNYFLAELTKARISASVVMSIETDPNVPAEEFDGDGDNVDGSKAVDIGHGSALDMPAGRHLSDHTPNLEAAFEPFVKQSNRWIASGMNVAYHKLCNDLAGINYSSGRLGELEERDFWMEMQSHWIEGFRKPVYEAWLRTGLLWGGINLALGDVDRFRGQAVKYEPRRWAWVDPLKDVQANTLLVQNGFDTHERILNSQGYDLEETYTNLAREQDLADSLDLKLGTDIRGQETSEVNSADDADADEGEDAKDGEEKPSRPKAQAKPAPAKPKGRSLARGMHPANAELWDLTKEE